MTLEELAAQEEEKQKKLIEAKWMVGFKDRGLGHGDFGVITAKGEFIVGPCSHEIAGHIVEVHNNARDAARAAKKQSQTGRGRKTRSKDAKR
jgi:hypothetical protein